MENKKTLTFDWDDYETGIEKQRYGEVEHLTDLILEYYEDGKYHYSNFKSQGIAVDGETRKVKCDIGKWLKLASTKRFFGILMEYIYEIDESIPKNQREKISQLRKQIKELNENKENDFNKRLSDEVELRVSDYRESEAKQKEYQSSRIRDLTAEIHKYEKLLEQNYNSKTDFERQQADTIVELELEIKELKADIKKLNEKKPVGRPPLDDKEKKRLKKQKMKEKYKKKLKALSSSGSGSEDDSSSSSESDSD